jgi:hypothetical protein
MKYSVHSLIPFLPLFCSCQFRRLDTVQFNSSAPKLISREAGLSKLDFSLHATTRLLLFYRTLPYNHSTRTPRKTLYSIVERAFLLTRFLTLEVPLLSEFACAGMCLPSRCLAMGIHVTICYCKDFLLHDSLNKIIKFHRQSTVKKRAPF